MKELFTVNAHQVLMIAETITKEFHYNAVGTDHLLYGIVSEENGIAGKVLREMALDPTDIKNILSERNEDSSGKHPSKDPIAYSTRAREVINRATEEARRMNQRIVGTEHLLLAIVHDSDSMAHHTLELLNLNPSEVRTRLLGKFGIKESRKRSSRKKEGTSSGTPTLDALGRNLTVLAQNNQLDPIIGRDQEVRRMVQILSRRTKNNPVLVGDPGVGKTAIVEGIAQRIVTGDVPAMLRHKRVMRLDIGSLIAGTKYRGEFEDRVKKMIDEINRDGQVIVFIDELHTLIGAGSAEGAMDASNLLKPALARGELQVIGATTQDEYQKYIERDPALERRFAAVKVAAPSESETLDILEGLKPPYEAHHRVTFTPEALKAAVTLSARYIADRQLPDKAIDLIDEAAAKVQIDQSQVNGSLDQETQRLKELNTKKEQAIEQQAFQDAAAYRKKEITQQRKVKQMLKQQTNTDEYGEVTAEHIAEVVSQWTGIPLTEIQTAESDRLLNLEALLHERVVGQSEGVKSVARAIRRARSGLKDPNRPIGSFLFLGPTGVGKTELAKALAEAMFGDESNLIRVDMSEFMEKHTTSRLIGSPPGYVGHEEGGQLTEKIRQTPYSVVLLDEIEKAHPDIFNLMLQVLDDGHITDGKGRVVDFKNTIIIMTSNLGATTLRDEKVVGFSNKDPQADYQAMKKRILDTLKNTFRPEFINRIDELVVFHALETEQLHAIVKQLAQTVVDRLEAMGIHLNITHTAIDILAQQGYQPEYGARPLKRTIQTEIEDRLSDGLLSGDIASGDKVTIGARSGELYLKVTSKKDQK